MPPAGIFNHPVGRFWAVSRSCVQGAPYGGLIGSVADAARGAKQQPGSGRTAGEKAAPTTTDAKWGQITFAVGPVQVVVLSRWVTPAADVVAGVHR
jgi:hypothetical protein